MDEDHSVFNLAPTPSFLHTEVTSPTGRGFTSHYLSNAQARTHMRVCVLMGHKHCPKLKQIRQSVLIQNQFEK